MTTTPKIWASHIMFDTRLQSTFFEYDYGKGDPEKSKKAVEILHRYRKWQPLEVNEVPDKMFLKVSFLTEKEKMAFGDVFRISGGLTIISERFANLLKDFDLGATQLFEIPLFDYDQETQRPGKYYLLNVAETKPCFIPEQSRHAVPGKYTAVGTWRLWGIDEVAVLSTAQDGADMWADPVLKEVIFMSDRLVKAIKAAKLTPDVSYSSEILAPCKIVVPN